MKKIKWNVQKDMGQRTFWIMVALVTIAKVVLSRFQMVYTWIDGAPIDDELMFRAAQSITAGQWLGDYDWLTLSKHMFFPVWAALCHALHIPYLAAGQLLACGASLAAAQAFRPALPRNKSRFLLFVLLAFSPAVSAEFTLRFYRDNIFPALCMIFFAGLCGYALRCRQPFKKGVLWLGLSGAGFALAWLTREDGMWLMPFAITGTLILAITALRFEKNAACKVGRCAMLLIPFAVLAAGILGFSTVNAAHYGLFAVSDFSSGSFAEAMGALNRVKEEKEVPRVSVPTEVREKLYPLVPELAPLEKWLEKDEDLQNSFRNSKYDDYQSGSFYWAIRKAAWYEGAYQNASAAEVYWKDMADHINELCDIGSIPSEGGRRVGTTPPIKAEYVGPVIQEGIRSFFWTIIFRGCEPCDRIHMSIGLPEDLAVWENYLGCKTNSAAQAGTALPYYSPMQNLVYTVLETIRWIYAIGLPILFAAALVLQIKKGIRLWKKHKEGLLKPGEAMLWVLLLGLLGMALLRCFMIAFMEVASFGIGTYAMYLSTVHPLLILFAAAGTLTVLDWNKTQKE